MRLDGLPDVGLAEVLCAALPGGMDRAGIAVSGGGDSMALMHLLADWARAHRVALRVATVDHGLRPDAAIEAALVARQAAALGLAHDLLQWRGHDGRGNLQAQARAARYALLADWAQGHGLPHVCLGHTMDDQAETVLQRLARGSGVDGLAAMAPARPDPVAGVVWLRPLLGIRRAALRGWLAARGLTWAEDPGNDDPRFGRIAIRQALAQGAVPGLDVARLSATAVRMGAAARVLQDVAHAAAQDILSVEHGGIAFEATPFATLRDDTRWRLLAAAIRRVSGQPYRPRLATLQSAASAAFAGHRQTLGGCILSRSRGRIWIDREPAALHGLCKPAPGDWDGRWRLTGTAAPGTHLAALGPEGLAQRPGWRQTGARRTPLLTMPGVWRGAELLAAPTLPGTPQGETDWRSFSLWDRDNVCLDLSPD